MKSAHPPFNGGSSPLFPPGWSSSGGPPNSVSPPLWAPGRRGRALIRVLLAAALVVGALYAIAGAISLGVRPEASPVLAPAATPEQSPGPPGAVWP